jgi:alpha-glucosidase
MVVADVGPVAARTPSLPRTGWREVNVFGRTAGGARDPDLPAIHQREGSIVPIGPVVQHVDAAPLDTLDLLVCLDARGRAAGTLYEDAGDGYEFEQGAFRRTWFSARREGGAVRVTIDRVEGGLPRIERPIRTTVVAAASRAPLPRGKR